MHSLYNSQFCLGPEPLIIDSNWNHINIDEECVLSYHYKTKIKYKSVKFIVIGFVEEGDENKEPIEKILHKEIDFNDIRNITNTWVGRWIIILDGKIIQDAWGSIGIYFLKNIHQTSRNWFFSSLSLLCYKFEMQLQPDKLGKDLLLEQESNLPYTSISPVEFLELSSGMRYPINQPIFRKYSQMNAARAAKRIVNLISTATKRLSIEDDKWYLPLTGGRDSRLSGICLKKSNLNFTAFTFKKPWYGTSYVDKFLPKKIAFLFNVKHKTISSLYYTSKLEILHGLKKHLGSSDVKDDVPGSIGYYFTRGYWLKFDEKGILVTSLYFDLIEGTFANFNRELDWFLLNGYNIDDKSMIYRRQIMNMAFYGFEDEELIEKGVEYWCFRQKGLAIAMTALEYSGMTVFAPAVCAEISSLGLSCNKTEILNNSIHIEAMKLYNKQLVKVRFDYLWDEPQKYFFYIKRGCPGLKKRLQSKFSIFQLNK